MLKDTGMDRCVEELSSTLELAQALEDQLEQVRRAVDEERGRHDATEIAA